MTKKQGNVVELRKQSQGDLERSLAQAMVCLKALDVLRSKLDASAKAAAAKWRQQLAEATKAYREPIREETDRATKDLDLESNEGKKLVTVFAGKFVDVVEGVRKHDEIKAEADRDKQARNQQLDIVELAIRECFGAGSSAQTELFATQQSSALGWATAQTKQVIYTAMLGIQEDGGVLDPIQIDVLAHLAADGTDRMDLGTQASTAVEADLDATDDGEEIEDFDEDTGVGF